MEADSPVNGLSSKIADHLWATQEGPLPEAALVAVSERLAAEHRRLETERARVLDPSLTERGIVYAIHDSDLKLMDESTALAAALWTLTSNPIAVLAKLVALLYRLRRKRGRFEEQSALVLLTLKDAPSRGWTVAEVRDHLGHSFGVVLSEDGVQTLLSSLKNVRLADGTTTDFADEHQGRWFAVDV